MPAGQCWSTAQSLDAGHQAMIKDMFPAGIERIFIDLADVPEPEKTSDVDTNWVNHVMENMADGLRYWVSNEGDHSVNGTMGEGRTKAHLIMCKTIGAIPLLCIGHTEERTSWLTRNPIAHTTFLEKFCFGLAHYLRDKLGFIQAHLEVFNEPKKCIPADHYAEICIAMGRGFKQYKNFKVHIGSNDIEQDLAGYIQHLVMQKEVLKYSDYYATHVLWPREHNQGYVKEVNEILFGTGLKQSVTEFSPDGDWNTFNELVDNGIEIYNMLFAIRNIFHTDVLDDIYIFDKHKGPEIISYNESKHLALRAFNIEYYSKQLPVEEEDMELEKYYYRNKVTYNRDPERAGIRFIQSCFGAVTDGKWGTNTDAAVEAYQISKGLDPDKIIGPLTFGAMVKEFPNNWNELNYNRQVGAW